MIRLKAGDSVSCRVLSAHIVEADKLFDDTQSFVIVAVSDEGYYIYVPHYYFLKDIEVLDKYRCKTLKIEKRFLGENITYIHENMIVKVESKQDGMACRICHDFYPYATVNQEDGTMVCYSCRQNPY
jgi:hypothetical protein